MRNNNLKRFLTTASALGMIAIGAQEASAADHTSTGDVTVNAAGAAVVNAGGANWAAGDTITFAGPQNLTFGADALAHGLDLGGFNFAGKVIAVNNNVTLGAIGNANAAAGSAIALTIADGKTLILAGAAAAANVLADVYTGLGAVTIGSGATATATTINVNTADGNAATFTNTFDAYGGNTGAVLTSTNDGNIFKGNIGGTTALNVFNATGNTNFGGAAANMVVKAKTINVAAVKTLDIIGHGVNYTSVTGNIVGSGIGNGSVLVSSGTNAGVANLIIGNITGMDTFTVTTDAKVGGAAGTTHVVANTTIADTMTLTLDSTAGATSWTGIMHAVAGGNHGILTLQGTNGVTINGDMGVAGASLSVINVNDNTTFKPRAVGDAGNITATTITIANNKTLVIDSTNLVVAGAFTNLNAANAGNGILTLQGANNITMAGAVGTGVALQQINMNATGGTTYINGAAKVSGGNIDASNSTAVLNHISGVITAGSALVASVATGGNILTGASSFTADAATNADGNITVATANGNAATFTGVVTTTATKGGNFDASGALAGSTVHFGGGAASTIDGTFKTGAGVFTLAAGSLVVTNSAGAAALAAGGANAGTAITIGAGGGTFTGAVTATIGDIVVNNIAGGPATTAFTGGVTTTAGGKGNFTTNAGVVTVGAASTIDGIVTTGAGTLTTAGGLFTITNKANAGTALAAGPGGAVFGAGLTVAAGNADFSLDTTGSSVTGALTMGGAAGSLVKVGAGGLTLTAPSVFTNAGTINIGSGTGLTYNGTTGGNMPANVDIVTSTAGSGKLTLTASANAIGVLGNIGATGGTTTALGTITIGDAGAARAVTIGGGGSNTTVVAATNTYLTDAANSILNVNGTVKQITYSGTIDGLNGAGQGILQVVGNAAAVSATTFTGNIGYTKTLASFDHKSGFATFQGVNTTGAGLVGDGAAATATFNKDVTFGAGLTIDQGSNVTFLGNVNNAILQGGNAASTVTFGNGTNASFAVKGDNATTNGIGGGAALDKVNINLNGGTLTVTSGAINTAATVFQTDGILTINSTGIASLGAVTATTGGTGTINLNNVDNAGAGYVTTGSIGQANNAGLKAVNLGNNVVLNVANNNNVFAAISGAGGTVKTQGISTLTTIGAKGANVTAFTTAAAAVTVDSVYANTITNAGNITANVLSANATTFTNTGTINLNDEGTMTAVTGGGNVALNGTATIGNISGANTLDINATTAGTVFLNGNVINVTNLNHHGNVLQVTQNNTTLTGATNYTIGGNATIDMNGTTGFAIAGGGLVIGANTLTVLATYDPNSNNVITTAIAPTIAAGGVVNISFTNGSPADGAVLNVFGVSGAAAGTALPFAAPGTSASVVYVANPNATGLVDGFTYYNANVVGTGTAAAPQFKAGTLVVSAKATAAKFNNDATVAAMYQGIAAGTTTGEAATMGTNFANMNQANRNQAVSDFNNHDGNVTSAGTAAAAVQAATGAAASATKDVANVANVRIARTAEAQGVASGDSAENFGAWAQIIGGVATQKQRKGTSGFSSNMMGGVLGADTMISDNASIGMLVADISNRAKLKDASQGDKLNSNTWMFGLYGNYDIGATDFFVQGNMTVGQTAVDSKTKRTVSQVGQAAVVQTARGKYDILGVGAELVGGYKVKFDNSYLAPSLGVRYNYFGDATYTETGLTVANQAVKTKATSMVSGLAGVRFGADVDLDGTMVKPEVHGNVSYAFNAPSSKTNFKINGAQNTFTYNGPKASRFGANFGAGVMAEADGFEYGVGYDANIADKYLAHQGSLKVKVKF